MFHSFVSINETIHFNQSKNGGRYINSSNLLQPNRSESGNTEKVWWHGCQRWFMWPEKSNWNTQSGSYQSELGRFVSSFCFFEGIEIPWCAIVLISTIYLIQWIENWHLKNHYKIALFFFLIFFRYSFLF